MVGRFILQSGVKAGRRTVGLGLRPARRVWDKTWEVERRVLLRLADGGGQLTVVCVDAALASPYADEVVKRIVESDLAEHAVARALSGHLVDVVAVDLVRYRVAERLVDNVVVRSALLRAVERALDGPELERLVGRALESPGAERVAGRVVESRVVEEASARLAEDVVGRLRESPALWSLIDDIAQSPTVLDAIAQQSSGLADEVSDELRERSRHADDQLERAAWRLFRRRPAGPSTSGAA